MEPLATAEELRIFLELDEIDAKRAELFLRLASGEVRAATGQTLSYVDEDVVLLAGKGSNVLLLPETPVLAVDEVLEAYGRTTEVELAGPDAASPAFEWSEDGILRRLDGGVFARRFRWYRVTYGHGWDPMADEVVAVVLRIAGRGYDDPEGLRQETIGRYSYTRAGEQAGVGLYAPDLADLVPYTLDERRGRPGTAAAGSGSVAGSGS